ncbi:MAG TPA: hypothetical protein VG324_14410, partial [Blastocatellia bacterium]|nr:hypothetical protein [Blastocatellia bacterium]
EAKTDGLESDKVQAAMAERADYEAERLADQIVGSAYPQLPRHAHANAIGYVQALSQNDPKGQSR